MSEYDKMMARVRETLDSKKKEKKDFENAKVTDKQRAEFTKKHGKDHGASEKEIKSYFKIQERKRLKRQSKLTGEQVKDPKAFEKEYQGGDTFKEMKEGTRQTTTGKKLEPYKNKGAAPIREGRKQRGED
jgi:hypothetical protein